MNCFGFVQLKFAVVNMAKRAARNVVGSMMMVVGGCRMQKSEDSERTRMWMLWTFFNAEVE